MLTVIGLLFLAVPDPAAQTATADPMYVIEGSIVQTGETRLATVVWPQDDRGLMSMRVEVDCTQQRWRALEITFYDVDGSVRNTTGPAGPAQPAPGWGTRNFGRLSARVCV